MRVSITGARRCVCVYRFGISVIAGAMLVALDHSVAMGAIVGGSATGEIEFHSTYFPDGSILPSHTTGLSAMGAYPGGLSHEAFAPGGAEHGYMEMSWDYLPALPKVFIPAPGSPMGPTRLEMVPSPPVPAHHHAMILGSCEVLFSLDAAGLPTITIPAQTYDVVSYVSPLPGSLAGATLDVSLDYFDSGFSYLGAQSLHYSAPVGFGIVSTVSTLPLDITIPAGHSTLKVIGTFMLTTDSDDLSPGGPPPYDTLIAIIPEPTSLACLFGLCLPLRRRMLFTLHQRF